MRNFGRSSCGAWIVGVSLTMHGLAAAEEPAAGSLRVGAAASDLAADDSMPIAGSIGPGTARGQEGKLRAVAVVLEKKPFGKFAIVACDVLFVTRDLVDAAAKRIEETCGIPAAHLLVNATHTHHAPSTVSIHGCPPSPEFRKRLEQGIVQAVQQANEKLTDDCGFFFHQTEESTIGQNSRLLLADNSIYWIGSAADRIGPTGPFDPQLPVLTFRGPQRQLLVTIYNHSTHTIGTVKPGLRSPSFYGLASQELEAELGGVVCFLEGASGSTHNLSLSAADCVGRLKKTIRSSIEQAQPRPVTKLAGLRRSFKFKVRSFDEEQEEQKVSEYCRKRAGDRGEEFAGVFRKMRAELKPHQGQERETVLQVLLVGDVALVGVPAEFFTKLGVDIKQRSPFERTYVAELANDWIGYLPDLEGHVLGGYQTWTGLHSYAEPGTGERVVKEVMLMLNDLTKN